MEDHGGFTRDCDDDQIKLHPGFRFHPTDEELITHYLLPKVLDAGFRAVAIGEADLNKMEPWDLPSLAKIGEDEWYFFCARDRKYPTGMRTNRATESGYWKATGKDKEIYRDDSLVGMKKTLVFYRGRAPKGVKTNWVIHEYRLEGKYSLYNLPESAKTEWVISRVFNKTSAGRKTHISSLIEFNHHGGDFFQEPSLPPLADASPYNSACETKSTVENHGESIENNTSLPNNPLSSSSCYQNEFQFSDSFFNQDQSTLKLLVNNNGDCGGNDLLSSFSKAEQKQGLSPGGGDLSGDGLIDLDCLLNY